MNFILTLSILALAPAAPDPYSATQAKRDYSQLLLAEGMMLACHTGTPAERKADEDRLHPRVAAFEAQIRNRFGDAIPATNRVKVDSDTCNSRHRYTKELERLLGQLETRVAGDASPATGQ